MSDTPKAPVKYSKVASQTDAGKEHEKALFHALGRFVVNYARAEEAIQFVLWHYAKTHESIARCVFSGVRVKDGMSFIKKIAEVTGATTKTQRDLKDIFDQLGVITSVRNEIMHHGIQSIADGNAFITNALLAYLPERLTIIPISPTDLDNMTADIRKIIVTLYVQHAGRPPLQSEENRRVIDEFVRAPWRYKPLVRHPLSPAGTEKSPRARKQTPKRTLRPPPSQA